MALEREYVERRQNNQNEDEISLLDLYRVLVKRQSTILITLIVVILLCVIYLVFAPKVYSSSVMLLPPFENEIFLTDLDGVSLKNVGIVLPLFLSKAVNEALKAELKSKTDWNDFIRQNSSLFHEQLKGPDDENILRDNPLKFTTDKDFPVENVVVTYESKNRDGMKNVLNKYLMFVQQKYIDEALSQARQKIAFHVSALETDIKDSRAAAEIELNDEITLLESNLVIAKKLGIADNQLVTIKNPQALTVVTSNLKNPEYMKGVKVLTAELEQLRQRTSNDPYIDGLRLKQSTLKRLQNVKFTPETFRPLRMDGGVTQPVKVKPKAKLVLALGIILGLMLGIFAAFFAEFLQKARSAQP